MRGLFGVAGGNRGKGPAVVLTMEARTVFDGGGGEDVAWTEELRDDVSGSEKTGRVLVRQRLWSGETMQFETERALDEFPAPVDVLEPSPTFAGIPLAICGISKDNAVQVEIGRRRIDIPEGGGYAVGMIPEGEGFSLTEEDDAWRDVLRKRLEDALPAAVLRIENLGIPATGEREGGDGR